MTDTIAHYQGDQHNSLLTRMTYTLAHYMTYTSAYNLDERYIKIATRVTNIYLTF
jgi:hypothetical protein